MKEKFWSKVADVRDYFRNQAADIYDIRQTMFDRHPFVTGCIDGCIIWYLFMIITCKIAKVFFKKELGWVDKK